MEFDETLLLDVGFESGELDAMFADLKLEEDNDKDDEVPELLGIKALKSEKFGNWEDTASCVVTRPIEHVSSHERAKSRRGVYRSTL